MQHDRQNDQNNHDLQHNQPSTNNEAAALVAPARARRVAIGLVGIARRSDLVIAERDLVSFLLWIDWWRL